MFDINFINNQIKKNKIINKIIFFKKIHSTNDFLREKNFSSGTIALAEIQIAGKGKLGKKWISEKGGLWFSFIINKKIKTPYIYVILTSVAVVDVLKKHKVSAAIKWPNDVLVNNKKICGILVENDYYKSKIITGVGININNRVPQNTDIPAVSLKKIKKGKININRFFIDVIKKIDKYISKLKMQKKMIIKKWLKNQYDLINKEIKIMKNGKVERFKVIKINKNGNILVNDEKKHEHVIKPDIFFI